MSISKTGLARQAIAVLISVGLLNLAGTAMATEQSKQRQEGRDAKQDAKQDARSGKVDCKAADQKSNAECRQEKRDIKH